MERYFDKPILLIEFDESMDFKLNDQYSNALNHNVGAGLGSTSSGIELSPSHIISKLSLLTIHFKKL